MHPQRFDRFTKSLGHRLSRRSALSAGVGLSSLALTGAAGVPAAAQNATPAATPVAADTTTMLFVQTFASGSLMPKTGEEGVYLLTLQGAHGRTIGFTDRPERIVGSIPTQAFLDGLGFSPNDPPNAALVIEPSEGETDVIVLELLNPQYDEASATLVYDVRVLEDFESNSGLGFQETPRLPNADGEEFSDASLFIDDCPNWNNCYANGTSVNYGAIPGGPYGTCWSWGNWECLPDNCSGGTTSANLVSLCVQTYGCDGGCYASS